MRSIITPPKVFFSLYLVGFDLIDGVCYTFYKMLSFLIDLFFPQDCKLCARVGAGLVCNDCISKIEYSKGDVCRRCTRALPLFNGVCKECAQGKWYFKEALFLGPYKGILKDCIHLYKYCRRYSLSKLLSSLCIEPLKRRWSERFDYAVAVPMHKRKERERGFNQAQLLAKWISKRLGVKLANFIKKIKDTPSQTQLDYRYRQENVKGSFRVYAEGKLQKRVLLIDDVFTTGATANECARLLSQKGAEIYFFAICYTQEV
jgi:ComF family protein